MVSKKYFWLKLKDDFFEDDTIQFIEERENGKEYVLIYLKLCLKALKEEGVLVRYVGNTLMPYDANYISKLTNSNIDTVRVAVELFKGLGLVEVLENGEMYLSQLNELVGVETEHAVKKRKQRLRKKTLSPLCLSNVPTEIEIEKDIDKELEIDKKLKKDKEKESKKEKEYLSFPFLSESDCRVKLTLEQYDKLIYDYGSKVNDTINKMNDYLIMHGKSYKNYSVALRTWLKKDENNKPKYNNNLNRADYYKTLGSSTKTTGFFDFDESEDN